MRTIMRHLRDWWPVVILAVACMCIMLGLTWDEVGGGR
jgi:hypothetical protein